MPINQHVGEDPSQAYARYMTHAENIVEVVLDPTEKPLFAGENGRLKTALAIASIETFETNPPIPTREPSRRRGKRGEVE